MLADKLGPELARELGVFVPYPVAWPGFLEKDLKLVDVLDLVTIAHRLLVQAKLSHDPGRWRHAIQRIFDQENVHYCVDDQAGVHFRPDNEFAHNRAATVAALQGSRYANALDAFERGMAALASVPPDGKGAVRYVFGAVETLFRLMVPRAPRLGATELDGLAPLLQHKYAADETALRVSAKILGSLKDWVDAAHFYRHEPGAEEVAQPPLEVAIHILSTGASHLRWLAELDAAIRGGET